MSEPTHDAAARTPAEDQMDLDALLEAFSREGAVLGDFEGLSKHHYEALYGMAYNLYEAERYRDARELFCYLCSRNHLEQRFWLGLGACQQMLGLHDQATTAYAFANLLDVDDPRSALHAGECLLASGQHTEAADALNDALTTAGAGTGGINTAVAQRAQALLATVSSQDSTGMEA
ncbi:SycD/LcrH family type III secretion system chaperone [uncultured Thiohalocapsa sp.]|jgi:type III secretion low calcium response chaperone LcrH/SycD|uniref:SycD/LcrH family type III secretion system chaperone n=1 Tax=uncultured Thiohalocapsa sp. TaxID=768990 RepID=UPI0025FDCE31|nr:SycD/LcrH family type III secretion system chaperone [uncultured Thiohalocapsa sp.]